jgi:hypothetical protein
MGRRGARRPDSRNDFSEGEERLLASTEPDWPDPGTYAPHTTFRRELNGNIM